MSYIFSAIGRILRLHERTVIVASDGIKTAISIPFEEQVGRLLEIKKDNKSITLVYENIRRSRSLDACREQALDIQKKTSLIE
jgi:hypothetical protein